jgi:VanZ family protein
MTNAPPAPLLRALAIGVVIAIWVLSLMPGPPGVPGSDKLHHFLAYAGCMGLWAQVLTTPASRIKALMAIVAMGIAIEFLQGWSGFRTFEVADMVANTGGAICGWIASRIQATLTRKHFSSGA